MDYVIRLNGMSFDRVTVIEDDHGVVQFRAHGPTVRIRDELRFDDAQGAEQFLIKEPVLGNRKKFELWRGGAHYTDVTAIGTGNLLEGFDVGGRQQSAPLHARGDMLGREFTIVGPEGLAAQVRRKGQQSMEVHTASGQNDALLLASVIAISAMTDAWAHAGSRAQ